MMRDVSDGGGGGDDDDDDDEQLEDDGHDSMISDRSHKIAHSKSHTPLALISFPSSLVAFEPNPVVTSDRTSQMILGTMTNTNKPSSAIRSYPMTWCCIQDPLFI
jgi:hypothetical protein